MRYPIQDKKILVVGDIMLDRYWSGTTNRTSPEAPVPIVKVNDESVRVGGCGNVALNIRALTGQAHVIAMTGQDEPANELIATLTEHGVEHTLLQYKDYPTIVKLRVLSHHQQMLRLDFEESFANQDKSDLEKTFTQALSGVDLVILSDYAKGVLSDPQPLIQAARKAKVPVLVDPKGQDFTPYRGATLITPNQPEFEAIIGPCPDNDTLEQHARRLVDELELEALLVTRGGQGMSLIQKDKRIRHVAATSKDLIDVTGAGDTVIATLGLAIAAGYPLPAAMHLSNLAAGIVVSKPGTATANLTELKTAYAQLRNAPKGIMTRERLAKIVKDVQMTGREVVFTNGCFDVLHAGHVTYLEKARERGDRLIVAVNDDGSVQRLKGPTRPVSPIESRMRVLAALECVDWVVAFNEDTPEALLQEIQPDILVKGGDYQSVDDIVGADIVMAYGGRAELVKHDQTDISTTKLLDKLNQ